MKIILLENVHSLGKLSDIVEVRPGFARNYLFPQGKAERVTSRTVEEFKQRRAELEKRQQEQLQVVQNACAALDGYLLQLSTRASPDGNLYGSITAQIVANTLNKQGIEGIPHIKRNQVILKGGPIKTLGNHPADIKLYADVSATITVATLAETEHNKQPMIPTMEKINDDNPTDNTPNSSVKL